MTMKLDANVKSVAVTESRNDPVTFIVTLALRPGCKEEFLDLLMPALDAMRHETTFINAVLHQDPQDPARFMIYETWADLDDVVEIQMHREYRKAYWERLPALLREPRQVETWKPMRRDFAFFAGW
jgi:quinol monooxygenase YgiN